MSSADVFASHQPRIRRYIASMVRDPVEVDDLTQEVFLQAHRKLDLLRDPDALTPWLYRIATHVTYDWFRMTARRPRLTPLEDSESGQAITVVDQDEHARLDRVLERREMSACVRRFLEELPDQYRQVILLHDLEGLTNADIAEMLGTTLGATKIRLHRARQRLQQALAGGCEFSHDQNSVLVCESTATVPPRHRPF